MTARIPRRSRAHIHEPTTRGEVIADQLVAIVGSWRFIIWQNIIVTIWIIFNLIALFGWHWDPYPFILLNLVFSWQASNTGPVVMMSQNRQAQKDRIRDDHEAEEVDLLYTINEEQLELLHLLNPASVDLPAQLSPASEPSAGQ